MVDEARRKHHAVVEERHNDRSCPHARKTGLFVVRLTTAHQPRRSDAPHDATTLDRRRLHALVSLALVQSGAACASVCTDQ